MDFVCQPASQPAIIPGSAKCSSLKVTAGYCVVRIYETVVPKMMVILLSFLAFARVDNLSDRCCVNNVACLTVVDSVRLN